jgi:hypothetical protein
VAYSADERLLGSFETEHDAVTAITQTICLNSNQGEIEVKHVPYRFNLPDAIGRCTSSEAYNAALKELGAQHYQDLSLAVATEYKRIVNARYAAEEAEFEAEVAREALAAAVARLKEKAAA